MAFTPWHLDAVSGSHPPHLLSGLALLAAKTTLICNQAGIG